MSEGEAKQSEPKVDAEQVADKPHAQGQKEAKEERPKKTGYRVENEKRFEINRSHNNRREKAVILRDITMGLFGRRRYTNIILVSSLNNFYNSLRIANLLQKRVENLALVISMEKLGYTEFAEEGAEGETKEDSIFEIKITRNPTEEDKKNGGFNPGFENIENPLNEVMRNRNERRNHVKKGKGQRGGSKKNSQVSTRRQSRGRDDTRPTRRDREDRRDRRETSRPDKRYPQSVRSEEWQRDRRVVNKSSRSNYIRNDRQDNRQNNRQDNRQDSRQGGQQDRPYTNNRGVNNSSRRGGEYDRRENPNYRNNYVQMEDDFSERRRYRHDRKEVVQDDRGYLRGGTKTRGGPRGGANVAAGHSYNNDHIRNRDEERREQKRQERREDRQGRNPRKNRYSSDEEY